MRVVSAATSSTISVWRSRFTTAFAYARCVTTTFKLASSTIALTRAVGNDVSIGTYPPPALRMPNRPTMDSTARST
ncbi:hypothetical protein COSO111634_35675 [Corallococcus soli]